GRLEPVGHELDGDWQFMGDEPITDYTKIGMVVALEEIIKKDNSVLKVADLPKGYQATRKGRKDKWAIVKIEYSDVEIAQMGFICSECGELHKEIPMAYGASAPYKYFQIPANELNDRCELTQDTCIIDEKDFYIKGQLNIPVDNNDRFCWNVWVLISREDFLRSIELWHEENRFLEKPYEGKMATKLDCYPDTLNLDVLVYTQKIGITPEIEVIESTNPIFFEQQNGISMERVISFARQILYAH
ncbi:MAG: DUF2199 domain-containing protein, partial [Mucilaginibacter sp.]